MPGYKRDFLSPKLAYFFTGDILNTVTKPKNGTQIMATISCTRYTQIMLKNKICEICIHLCPIKVKITVDRIGDSTYRASGNSTIAS